MPTDHRVASALSEMAPAGRRIAAVRSFGLVLDEEPERVAVHRMLGARLDGFTIAREALPLPLASRTASAARIVASSPTLDPDRVVHALFVGAARPQLMVAPLADASGLFWMCAEGDEPLTDDQLRAGQALGDEVYRLAIGPERPEDARSRLERLDGLDAELPSLDDAAALDAYAVLERAAEVLGRSVPSDELTIALADAVTLPPRAGKRGGVQAGRWKIGTLPPMAPLLDGLRYELAMEVDPEVAGAAAPEAGFRSVLRVPIRQAAGGVLGVFTLHARATRACSPLDLFLGIRVAGRTARALSYASMTQERTGLRVRAAAVERLDELLLPLARTGDVREAFDQISSVARDVLPHDAVMLPVRVGDGSRATLHAASGFPAPLPDTVEVPPNLVRYPDWDYDIVDDIQLDPAQRNTIGFLTGFRSLLRLSVQLDGQFAGALVFLSRTPSLYTHDDLPLARRMADRLALALSRARREEASRRADEATERARLLEARVEQLVGELDERTGHRRVVGGSLPWRQVLTQAAQVARTSATVLLLGESGTGKEVVARFLHRASERSSGPFVALNCAALPENLLEAELFGYERGAFTGATQSKPGQIELAAGGTLFLDEVAEMNPTSQAKLLRVLQERELQRLGAARKIQTDARVIAATNRDLEKAMARGQFREDLFYRLNVFSIHLPPLRDRRDDILTLSAAFLADMGRAFGRPPAGISQDARQALSAYHWPGNVRELRNVLERAAILCDGGLITSDHLALRPPPVQKVAQAPPPPAAPAAPAAPAPPVEPAPSAGDLPTIERAMIERALKEARFNKSRAAKALGLTRAQLYVRLRRHGLE